MKEMHHCMGSSFTSRWIGHRLKLKLFLLAAFPLSSFAMESQFSAIALSDLARAKQVLLDAHPAPVLGTDAPFNDWLIRGYEEAKEWGARATNRQQAFAAVRYYISGFRDGHVAVWNPKASTQAAWAGWTVGLTNGQWRVAHEASRWPAQLPEKGDLLVSCDGLSPAEYIKTHISPFMDRRTNLLSVLDRLAFSISNRSPHDGIWDDQRPRACIFESGGKSREYPLVWNSQEAASDSGKPQPRLGVEQWGKNRYWIYAQQFLPFHLKKNEVEDAITAVEAIPENAETVVFDTRGNNGGSSLYGYQLLAALMRKDTPITGNGAQAWWRPSRIAVDWFSRLSRDALDRAGPEDISFKKISEMKSFLEDAHRRSGPDVLVSDDAIEGSQYPSPPDGNSFKGRVILLTDRHCASACLDFADLVLSVPGALHVGEPTSADSDYLDIAVVDLPSGLQMAVPQKVWTGRTRKANEPLIPRHAFSGDIHDTPLLRTWLESLLLR